MEVVMVWASLAILLWGCLVFVLWLLTENLMATLMVFIGVPLLALLVLWRMAMRSLAQMDKRERARQKEEMMERKND